MRRAAWVLIAGALLACSLVRIPVFGGPSPTASPANAVPPTTPSPGIVAEPTPGATPSVEASTFDRRQQEALQLAFAGDEGAFPSATRYWIFARVEFDAQSMTAKIAGEERLVFTNPLAKPMGDFVLMLWPNDAQYDSHMTAGDAVINGVVSAPTVEKGGIALRYALPEPLEPGARLDVTLPFEIEAAGPIGAGEPKRFGITDGMLAAPTFYPLVPRLAPDGAWHVEAAPPGGDTTNSDIALYEVHLTVPGGLQPVASGTELSRATNPDGTVTVTYASGPVRDFAFALGPFTVQEQDIDGARLRAWILPEHESDGAAVAKTAAAQLDVLTQLVGPYPYTELDVVDAPGAFGGIEYPGLVFIGTVGGPDMVIPTVHEVAHQWFYGLIGNDQLQEPWLDEAAATYAESLYYEFTGNPTAATGRLSEYRRILRSYGDASAPAGLPIAAYRNENEYALFVYLKGALFFDALRGALGDAEFQRFLQTYFQEYRYKFASAADFQAVAEQTCGCDLQPLFNLWIYQGGAIPGL